MTTNIRTAYKKLMTKTRDLIVLQSVEAIMDWDMHTMMPPKAVELRSQQIALLSLIQHKMSTDPQIGRLLKQIAANPDYDKLDQVEKRNLHLIKQNYEEQTALPKKLVAETAKQQAITVNTWKNAKNKKDFAILKPELEKLVSLSKQIAEILRKVKETATPYDALIDVNEPKMTSTAITAVFSQLQKGLKPLLSQILNAPKQPNPKLLKMRIPVETQREIARALAETVGYETATPDAGGRIDETEHPFTIGYYDDVRITTHYHPGRFTSSVFSVLHEAGHAIYYQNMKQEWRYQPVGTHCSFGIHESQSRFMENIIGRSREFWTSVLPTLKKIAPNLGNLDLDAFVRAINVVKPSKIRIEADEVTYDLHIVIRFLIERDLFAERIQVSELPEVWNQMYREHLGVSIENDAEGVMQDTHWPSGFYGYFPSYTLGNVYSGQLLGKLSQDIGDWRSQLAEGNLKDIKRWLVDNVHSRGNLYDPADLIEKITGCKLDAEPYLEYLREKYGVLYGF